MTNRLVFPMLLLAVLALSACGMVATADSSDPTPQPLSALDECPVTQPSDPPFVPPEPHPAIAPYGEFWHGSDALWVLLQPDGHWYGLPRDEHGYGQKVFWFREGYDMTIEQKPQVTVNGRQLDGDGAFEQTGATNGHHPDMGMFMLTGVTVPAAGCWEITGHYGEASLSFVVWVEP